MITSAIELWDLFLERAETQTRRSIRDFCEQEIVLPDDGGPFSGEPWRVDMQPVPCAWWVNLEDSIKSMETGESQFYNRFAITGPTQSGKTFSAFIAVILYVLFELKENIVVGVPQSDMAADKWKEILEGIKCSSYANQVPKGGSGSRGGGKFSSVDFQNGTTLKFLSADAGVKAMAGFTARFAVMTEIDGYRVDPKEGHTVDLIEGRLRSAGVNKIVILECTVSTANGRIWQEVNDGTNSIAHVQCEHCQAYVHPEQEDLVGWQEAENALAAEQALFSCPNCKELWPEEFRLRSLSDYVLLHEGQSIDDDGAIAGEPRPTRTFSMRYSAVHNKFVPAGNHGAEEWAAERAADRTLAVVTIDQQIWARPPRVVVDEDADDFNPRTVAGRVNAHQQRNLPPNIECLVAYTDVGGRKLDHGLIGFTSVENGDYGFVIDYGRKKTLNPDDVGFEAAIRASLNEWLDDMQSLKIAGKGVDIVGIDSGKWSTEIIELLINRGLPNKRTDRWVHPTKGLGGKWKEPIRDDLRDDWHEFGKPGFVQRGQAEVWKWSQQEKHELIDINATSAKRLIQDRFRMAADRTGSVTIFRGGDHHEFASEICAERWDEGEQKFLDSVTGKAKITTPNHKLDMVAGAFVMRSVWRWLQIEREYPPKKKKRGNISSNVVGRWGFS